MSNSATLPPSATMRCATARPRPETPPVTMARTEFACMRRTPFCGRRAILAQGPPRPALLAFLCRDPARQLVGGQAGGEQEALSDRYAEQQHELALRLGFDALGDQRQAEAPGDARDRLAHRHVGLVAGHALDEQLAELE